MTEGRDHASAQRSMSPHPGGMLGSVPEGRASSWGQLGHGKDSMGVKDQANFPKNSVLPLYPLISEELDSDFAPG